MSRWNPSAVVWPFFIFQYLPRDFVIPNCGVCCGIHFLTKYICQRNLLCEEVVVKWCEIFKGKKGSGGGKISADDMRSTATLPLSWRQPFNAVVQQVHIRIKQHYKYESTIWVFDFPKTFTVILSFLYILYSKSVYYYSKQWRLGVYNGLHIMFLNAPRIADSLFFYIYTHVYFICV